MTLNPSSGATPDFDPDRDLVISRIIAAPRRRVWAAWTDPEQLAQWWVPAPAVSRVDALELHPGGSFRTSISEDGVEFGPHIDGCILDVVPEERIVFTNSLVADWRPADAPFLHMTAIITMHNHAGGTEYRALVRHARPDERQRHADLGFADGWGTVTAQLAALAED